MPGLFRLPYKREFKDSLTIPCPVCQEMLLCASDERMIVCLTCSSVFDIRHVVDEHAELVLVEADFDPRLGLDEED